MIAKKQIFLGLEKRLFSSIVNNPNRECYVKDFGKLQILFMNLIFFVRRDWNEQDCFKSSSKNERYWKTISNRTERMY